MTLRKIVLFTIGAMAVLSSVAVGLWRNLPASAHTDYCDSLKNVYHFANVSLLETFERFDPPRTTYYSYDLKIQSDSIVSPYDSKRFAKAAYLHIMRPGLIVTEMRVHYVREATVNKYYFTAEEIQGKE